MNDSMDTNRIRRAFDRAASGFAQADFLHREIRARLLSRLPIIKIEPNWIIDLGAGTGTGAQSLTEIFPESRVMALDSSTGMLAEFNSGQAGPMSVADRTPANAMAAVCGDAGKLPINNQCIDLIFSNLLLQHCPDPITVLAEARRILRYPGVFAFTTFGPDSLRELREAWFNVDSFTHIAPFMDMHDLGDALIHAGFAEPVMHRESLQVTYQSLDRAMVDLRGVGSINATSDRNRGLTGQKTWQRLTDGYEPYRNVDGKLPVTIEVIYGLAWSGQADSGTPFTAGEFEIPLDDLRLFSRK